MTCDVTVVLTSCDRHDLLRTTLQSFRNFNTYRKISEIIVVEDGDADPSSSIKDVDLPLRIVCTGARKGQLNAVEMGYSLVETPYVFHCEDDWEFYRPGFIEKSKALLDYDLSTVCVWIRSWSDTNGHPLSFMANNRTFGVMALNYLNRWHGFTFNPSLRRLADFNDCRPFTQFIGAQFGGEAAIGDHFHQRGYRATILDEQGYVRHIGWHRHVPRSSD